MKKSVFPIGIPACCIHGCGMTCSHLWRAWQKKSHVTKNLRHTKKMYQHTTGIPPCCIHTRAWLIHTHVTWPKGGGKCIITSGIPSCFIPVVCRLAFICVTWLIHVNGKISYVTHCDMNHSYAWQDSFICVTGLIHLCDMTPSFVWHDSFICVTNLIHVCDTTHSYVWHDSFTRRPTHKNWREWGVTRIQATKAFYKNPSHRMK